MNRVAVLLWLYHKDLWPEFYSLLAPLSNSIHLYLGLEHGSDPNSIIGLESFDKLTISYHDNYGADVAPFLKQLQTVQEPLFIKLHSKKSIIGPRKQVHWRSVLVNDLIGSQEIFQSNIKKFNDQKIGLLGSKVLWWNKQEHKNSSKIEQLCDILNLPYKDLKGSYFIAGNMFMSRTGLYKSIFSTDCIKIIDSFLQKEIGKVSDLKSGKYAHSLERIFGYILQYKNLDFVGADHKSIMIKNDLADTGFFNLIELYNNQCYLSEDVCIFGKILFVDDRSYLIEWHHLSSISQQKYNIIQKNPIIIEKNVCE
jgi:lipopolysaccharide biosynthesis protein